jgi:hypothetical protein
MKEEDRMIMRLYIYIVNVAILSLAKDLMPSDPVTGGIRACSCHQAVSR